MSPAKLTISLPSHELSLCSPNLMPFHINYTGPAHVSSFLRVKKYEASEEGKKEGDGAGVASTVVSETNPGMECKDAGVQPNLATDANTHKDSGTELTPRALSRNETQSTIAVFDSQAPSVLSASSSSTTVSPETPHPAPPSLEDADKRFLSTFRGRTIHGLTIDLPDGYGGLVLKTEDLSRNTSNSLSTNEPSNSKNGVSSKRGGKEQKEEQEKEVPNTRRRGRLTRSTLTASRPSKPIEILDDGQDKVMVDGTRTGDPEEDITPVATADADEAAGVRQLIPVAQFSTFTLWQADRMVDKERDEYYRSLTEWISLANEIHCSD